MTIRRAMALYCDEEHGIGDVVFPAADSANAYSSDAKFDPDLTAVKLRRLARAEGWRRFQNVDYCPSCVQSMKDRGD